MVVDRNFEDYFLGVEPVKRRNLYDISMGFLFDPKQAIYIDSYLRRKHLGYLQ